VPGDKPEPTKLGIGVEGVRAVRPTRQCLKPLSLSNRSL
jgi:hypothetical protein